MVSISIFRLFHGGLHNFHTKRVKWSPRCYNSIRSETKRKQLYFHDSISLALMVLISGNKAYSKCFLTELFHMVWYGTAVSAQTTSRNHLYSLGKKLVVPNHSVCKSLTHQRQQLLVYNLLNHVANALAQDIIKLALGFEFGLELFPTLEHRIA